MEAHGDGGAVSALLQELQGSDRLFFGSGHAPQKVVPADTVEAEAEGGTDALLLQCVQKRFIDQPAIRVDGRQPDLPLGQGVDDFEKSFRISGSPPVTLTLNTPHSASWSVMFMISS